MKPRDDQRRVRGSFVGLGRNSHGALLKRELVIPGLESGNRADHLAESGATSKQTALDRSSSPAETTPTRHRMSDFQSPSQSHDITRLGRESIGI